MTETEGDLDKRSINLEKDDFVFTEPEEKSNLSVTNSMWQ